MISRWPVVSAIIFALLVFATSTVHAQGRSTGRSGSGQGSYKNTVTRPAVSPYLNLLRTDSSPAQNYYNLVRPQVDQRDATLQQGGELDALRQEVEKSPGFRGAGRGRMGTTGHHAEFMTTSHFYAGKGAAPAARSKR